MDGAHVSDVHLKASGHFANRRLRCAGGDQETLQEAQVAKAGGYREDCPPLGTVSLDRMLVFVEESGCEDVVRLDSSLFALSSQSLTLNLLVPSSESMRRSPPLRISA